MITDNLTKEQLLIVEQTLDIVYNGLKEEGLLNGEIKVLFHNYMNEVTLKLKQLK